MTLYRVYVLSILLCICFSAHVIAQSDCDMKIDCMQILLCKKSEGWQFIETNQSNFVNDGNSAFFFVFSRDGKLKIYLRKNDANTGTKETLIYSTAYKLIVFEELEQLGIRISKFSAAIEEILYDPLWESKSDVDFQILHKKLPNNKATLLLRYNSGLTEKGTVINKFG